MFPDMTHRRTAELAASVTEEQEPNRLTYLIKREHVLTAGPSHSLSKAFNRSHQYQHKDDTAKTSLEQGASSFSLLTGKHKAFFT